MKTMTAQEEGFAIDQIHSWIGHGMDNQIALIEGAFPWWEIVMMLRSSHAFVLPTAGEGWGCPPVQALACGLPVIAYDLPSFREIYRKGMIRVEKGDVKKLAEAIITLMENEVMREKLSRQALEQAGEYDWEKSTKETLEIIVKNI